MTKISNEEFMELATTDGKFLEVGEYLISKLGITLNVMPNEPKHYYVNNISKKNNIVKGIKRREITYIKNTSKRFYSWQYNKWLKEIQIQR